LNVPLTPPPDPLGVLGALEALGAEDVEEPLELGLGLGLLAGGGVRVKEPAAETTFWLVLVL
jgi:hypothetical protein